MPTTASTCSSLLERGLDERFSLNLLSLSLKADMVGNVCVCSLDILRTIKTRNRRWWRLSYESNPSLPINGTNATPPREVPSIRPFSSFRTFNRSLGKQPPPTGVTRCPPPPHCATREG